MKNKKKKIFIFLYFFALISLSIKNLNAETPIYILDAIKLSYKDNNKIIIAEGEAHAKDQFGKEIFSNYIIYDKVNNTIKTKNNSKYIDTKGNTIYADRFLYDLNLKKIEAIKKVKYFDKNNNQFNFTSFEYFENSEIGIGKNLKGKLIDGSTLEGNYAKLDLKTGETIVSNNEKKLTFFNKFLSFFSTAEKNNYTPCKKENDSIKTIKERCPDWSISTLNTVHAQNKKMVYHEHAVVKIRNIPVFYTPYFSHPDPSVKRKTGFLRFSSKDFTNLGRTFKSPFFWAINDSSDLTFTPIFYLDEHSIFLTDFRKQFKNSFLHLDTSYSEGYKDLNKKDNSGNGLNRTNGSRNHIFLNFSGSYENLILNNNDLNINFQRVSQKNYLEVNQINTDLVKQDISSLNNSISLNAYENNKKLQISTNIYENLKNDDPNTKYQYKIPAIVYSDYFNKFNNNFGISNSIEANNFGGDSKQISQTNYIDSVREQIIEKNFGISNLFKTKFKNVNLYNENINGQKNNWNNDLYATFALENSMPFGKFNNNSEQIIAPKILTKHTTGKMTKVSNNGSIFNYNDLYSMDRINDPNNPETGTSLAYGIDYEMLRKDSENNLYLKNNLSFGQVLQDKKNINMPSNSSLQDKSSDFVGIFSIYLSDKFFFERENNLINTYSDERGLKLNYDFNIANDLNKIQKNQIDLSWNDENQLIKINYYELKQANEIQSIGIDYNKKINNDFNFYAGVTKNLELGNTENNYFGINYDSDCLQIGLTYSKKFYQNQDVQHNKSLAFYLTLKPFGQPFAPDLKNLVN